MSRKIFQVHPSQYCNYSCSHCYSSSSPMMRGAVSVDIVLNAIADAADLGYNKLSVSGGEPLLVPYLKELLVSAKTKGMSTSLVTNGSFPEEKYQQLQGLVDTIGVSFDGFGALHNTVRQNQLAFEKASRFLGFAGKYFENVGMVYSLTDQSWESIPEVLELGKQNDISVFQVHPIEFHGRAKLSPSLSLSEGNLKRAYLLVNALEGQYEFPLQFDVLNKASAFGSMIPDISGEVATDIVDLLVMNERAEVLPYTYGMDLRWKVADLKRESLKRGWELFKQDLVVGFEHWCRNAIHKVDRVLFTPGFPYLTSSNQ
ncbi:radical SAM protein [Imperialibacter roseus]|uniref:Radical SAM protein n=1 Tax=Imperialibacter roseus TaxID=1324217 RepID=A0ABZ0IVY3_9BACT|nr:radical SAM protein [Imperialibacter roseus]WOK09208.1 radical SAM protein [Imperialibacter roseus]